MALSTMIVNTAISTLVPLCATQLSCFFKPRAPSERKKTCFVLPKGCGKSTLVRKLTGNNASLILVDLDEVIMTKGDKSELIR